MSLEDRSEIAITKLSQLINFIKTVEKDNYCDPEQFSDAQKIISTLVEELDILRYKLDYLGHGY
jgi:hypothetical protein